MSRALILTGGIGHPFGTATPALQAALAEAGFASSATEDIEGGLAEAARAAPELLVVYALRWTMRGSEKYAPHRDKMGFSLSEAGRARLTAHVARGGGLLALHTAIVCFDDWPGWRDLIGAVWSWGRSSHPPYGPIEARPTGRAHPIVAGAGALAMNDEVYGGLHAAGDLAPLLEAKAAAGGWHPVLWARTLGAGRLDVDALGHDAGAFAEPTHRRLVQRAALWASGRDPA